MNPSNVQASSTPAASAREPSRSCGRDEPPTRREGAEFERVLRRKIAARDEPGEQRDATTCVHQLRRIDGGKIDDRATGLRASDRRLACDALRLAVDLQDVVRGGAEAENLPALALLGPVPEFDAFRLERIV